MNAEEYALVVAAGFLRCVATRNISQNEMNAFVDVVVRNLATKRNVERIAAKLISILNESETDEIGFIVDRVKNCNKSDWLLGIKIEAQVIIDESVSNKN